MKVSLHIFPPKKLPADIVDEKYWRLVCTYFPPKILVAGIWFERFSKGSKILNFNRQDARVIPSRFALYRWRNHEKRKKHDFRYIEGMIHFNVFLKFKKMTFQVSHWSTGRSISFEKKVKNVFFFSVGKLFLLEKDLHLKQHKFLIKW